MCQRISPALGAPELCLFQFQEVYASLRLVLGVDKLVDDVLHPWCFQRFLDDGGRAYFAHDLLNLLKYAFDNLIYLYI